MSAECQGRIEGAYRGIDRAACWGFESKVVLIIGAAQGFGRVCALASAMSGAKLARCDINDDGGQETLRQVKAMGEGIYRHADISKEDDVRRLVEATVAEFGRLDVAVNNAAKEVAGPTLAVLYLASDEARFVVGAVLVVDGGFTAQ